jgi:ribosomal-protein-alanine N-acetyltransferase
MAEKVPVRIRRFKIEDIDKILEIEKQAFPKTAYPKATFLNYAKGLPDNFIVVDTGKDIAGYIIFDMSGHIHSTAVKPPYRRKGFGKMLFMHASKCAKKRLWLEVRSKNSAAIAFYKRLGWKTVRRIPNYYGSDDALIMVSGQKEWAQISTMG